jgi:hypothetical protein
MGLSKKVNMDCVPAELTLAWQMTLQRRQIATRQHIPVEFLEQITPGTETSRPPLVARMKGGCTALKSPGEITRPSDSFLDGPLAPLDV